jgi:hypothetical protein
MCEWVEVLVGLARCNGSFLKQRRDHNKLKKKGFCDKEHGVVVVVWCCDFALLFLVTRPQNVRAAVSQNQFETRNCRD